MKLRKKRTNKRINNKKTVLVLGILLLVIGIGYAFLSANLYIDGLSRLGNPQWDIHFENANEVEEECTATAITPPVANASDKKREVEYLVNFTAPGQVYEFTIDIKNGGDIDTVIEKITTSMKINDGTETDITEDQSAIPSYLTYDVKKANGDSLEDGISLAHGEKDTIKVRLEFATNISLEQLEELNTTTVYLTLGIKYMQDGAPSTNPNILPSKYKGSNPCTYDGEMTSGATYTNGDYEYKYIAPGTQYKPQINNTINDVALPTTTIKYGGWSVKYIGYPEEPNDEAICSSVNSKPIISMNKMYYESYVESIDFSSIDTTNVIDMSYMFGSTYNLGSIDLSNFNTSRVVYMIGMFESTQASTILGLDHLNTKKVVNMNSMFSGLYYISTLDLSSFDTKNVIDMSYMFGYNKVSTIYVSKDFDLSSKKTNCVSSDDQCDYDMFYECYYLEGGNGTSFYYDNVSSLYARIDKSGKPGYFTLKQ